ncbi:class I SAM-dependent methyltransferase [Telmatospirillum sp.]|uniref:class I SAM-dependent methyltransferase n=1 Tax=Telmatospirillum sp. TaxID=2079197 RepID=UPI0028445B56|nr:class I SAM-dependent methyltransferase [Telmatospirillum sp.]MDR3437556.1 class I SAM-dependent methyltransferase [Telmatospirillum sp.]
MSEPQNIYDNPEFFAGYAHLRQTATGLNDVLEQPALWSLLPQSLDGLRVLDLGCGFGDFARKARRNGARSVLAVDISAKMLAAAKKQTQDPAIEYRQLGIEHLDLDGGSFDIVVSSLAFHYVEDYPAAVARVADLLAPGGRLAFSVEHPICTAMAAQQWVRDSDGHALYWPIDDYRLEGARKTKWFVDGVVKYHRTVESYVNGLLASGLTLRCLKEPEPVAGGASAVIPGLDLHRRRPPFLLLAADR